MLEDENPSNLMRDEDNKKPCPLCVPLGMCQELPLTAKEENKCKCEQMFRRICEH